MSFYVRASLACQHYEAPLRSLTWEIHRPLVSQYDPINKRAEGNIRLCGCPHMTLLPSRIRYMQGYNVEAGAVLDD